jgi:hypothetical protein
MLSRRMTGFSSVLLVVSALAMALPGCGGGAQETNPDGSIKLAPITNPAPGALLPEDGAVPKAPAGKAR